MEYFKLGKNGRIPILGYGTWRIGGAQEPDYSQDDYYIKALRRAFEVGYTLIDTAEYYGAGHTEELIAEALKGFSREDFFITSKVWPNHLRYDDVLKSADASLKRLQTGYIDLYLIHWPNPQIPIKETVKALEDLVDLGKVRYIGVSNFNLNELREAIESTKRHEIVANQVRYSVLNKSNVEPELLTYAKRNDVRIIAYTPLEKGKMNHPLLTELASKYKKTVNQIALNYLICKEAVPIPKAVKEEHIIENFNAIGWRLSSEDVERLSKLA